MPTRVIATSLLILTACGGSSHGNSDGGGGGGDGGDPANAPPSGPSWPEVPAAPIVEAGAPTNAPDLFQDPAATATGGPCLLEPEIGALIPSNWLRPRFHLVVSGGQNLFEITLHVEAQARDLVIYTAQPIWIMPEDIWRSLASHVVDAPITITVRGAVWDGKGVMGHPATGTTGAITIAPAAASGAIVYWTTSNGTSLKGFHVGDEAVRTVMTTSQAGATECIGCHTSTPDGSFAAFSAYDRATGDRNRRADVRSIAGAARPSFVTPAASNLLGRVDQNAPSFSRAHWDPGDRIALSMYRPRGSTVTSIVWTNLEATSEAQGTGWGVVARTGDTRSAASARFSHDGQTIAYVSALNVDQSGVAHDEGDLYTVPYAKGAGGPAAPVAGASVAGTNEYYPDWSADDRLLAFNRAPGNSYDNASAEVFVVPATGGTATRLRANDPSACLAAARSPGVTNSWPKWSPGVTTVNDRTYYWLTFSSRRATSKQPQLYVAAVVRDGDTIQTFPAIYLWNQPEAENNHTPAWDDFVIIQ